MTWSAFERSPQAVVEPLVQTWRVSVMSQEKMALRSEAYAERGNIHAVNRSASQNHASAQYAVQLCIASHRRRLREIDSLDCGNARPANLARKPCIWISCPAIGPS